ncbi:MAG: hypothetical protein GEU68_15450 [Actinobacteria bacterium]|jgi:hypothetical protein|nr:hypothetical protein [Actinomycetota bacterium]
MWRMFDAILSMHADENGDVPGWVLIVLMSAGLVIAIWGIAEGRLVDIFSNALDTVCGGIGC